MFDYPRPSKPQQQDIKINLLSKIDRQSRVNFVRVNHKLQTPNKNIKIQRRSQKIGTKGLFVEDQQLYKGEDYSSLGAEQMNFSQSILTNPNQSNPCVGIILFVLLVVFTPLETLALNFTQQSFQLYKVDQMFILLIVCEFIAFAVLYYFKYIENITILKRYLMLSSKNVSDDSTLISKIIVKPYLLFLILVFLTAFRGVSYSFAIIQHQKISYLVLFYAIILPQIANSMYFEDEVQNHTSLKTAFVVLLIYLTIIGFLINKWVIFSSISGVIQFYLTIRAGRICILMEYIAKLMILIGLIIYQFTPYAKNQLQYNLSPIQNISLTTQIVLIVLCSISIIFVRFINNKVLRVELYKYYYSDSIINIALLCIPIVMGYIETKKIDYFVGVIGCGIFVFINWQVDRWKKMVNIQFPSGYQLQSPRK